nr:MAG TPA: DNA polymerase iota, Ubiquitin iota, ubiquitin, ubiquitin-binding motif [Bacteriophage sp.]
MQFRKLLQLIRQELISSWPRIYTRAVFKLKTALM